MKKILVILACVAMLFSFASCNDSPSVSTNEQLIAGYAAAALKSSIDDAVSSMPAAEYVDASTATITIDVADNTNATVYGEAVLTVKAETAATSDKAASQVLDSYSLRADITVVGADFVNHNVTITGEGYMDGTLAITLKDPDVATSKDTAAVTGTSKILLPANASFSNISSEDAAKIMASYPTLATYSAEAAKIVEGFNASLAKVASWTYTAKAGDVSAYLSGTGDDLTFKANGEIATGTGDVAFTVSTVDITDNDATTGISSVTANVAAKATLSGLTFKVGAESPNTVTPTGTGVLTVTGGTVTFSDGVVVTLPVAAN